MTSESITQFNQQFAREAKVGLSTVLVLLAILGYLLYKKSIGAFETRPQIASVSSSATAETDSVAKSDPPSGGPAPHSFERIADSGTEPAASGLRQNEMAYESALPPAVEPERQSDSELPLASNLGSVNRIPVGDSTDMQDRDFVPELRTVTGQEETGREVPGANQVVRSGPFVPEPPQPNADSLLPAGTAIRVAATPSSAEAPELDGGSGLDGGSERA